jgi:hypothetical protein
MENKKLIYFLTTCAVIIFIAMIPASAFSEGKTFSFRFESCTVTDALKEISAKSGVDIISNGTIKKEILRKSYVNRTIDSIITDLIRGENCAVVWNYNDGNLFSIDLFTPDEDIARRSLAGSNRNRSTVRDNSRSPFPSVDIDAINAARNNYLRDREADRSNNRSSSALSASRRPVERNSSNRIKANSNTVFGTSGRGNTNSSSVSGTSSGVSANIRRAISNKQNNKTDNNEPVTDPQPLPGLPTLPESPEPETGSGLEPPPMPPGLYND